MNGKSHVQFARQSTGIENGRPRCLITHPVSVIDILSADRSTACGKAVGGSGVDGQ